METLATEHVSLGTGDGQRLKILCDQASHPGSHIPARVAQSVERCPEEACVGGSNPSPGTELTEDQILAASLTLQRRARRLRDTADAMLAKEAP